MLVYSIVGALFGAVVLLLFKFCKSKDLPTGKFAGSYALMILGALAIAFSLDWGYASVIEGEPRAAAIGFLVFGGVGVVLALVGFRIATMKPKAQAKQASNAAGNPA